MQTQLDVRAGRMLVADWFRRLAREAGLVLNHYGTRGDSFTLGSSNAFNVTAKFRDQPPYLEFTASDAAQQGLVDSLAHQAFTRVASGDLGDVVWHSASMSATGFELAAPFSMGPFLEQLSVQTRIVGWRRLGRDVLIEFAEELPSDWKETNALFAPKALVHVHVAVSAPCHGHFSSYVAHAVLEVVAAISTFALGRGVRLPPSIRASRPEKVAELASKRTDPSVLTLARKHVPLDVFSAVAAPGGFEHFSRMRAAFLTFDAALQQQRDSVACMLYVVVAEVLSVPNAAWRDVKLTKRFIEFFRELIPADLDKMICHVNFESVFGIHKGRRSNGALKRELLAQIYDFRSGHVHGGLRPSYTGFGSGLKLSDSIRRSLFADFAEAAILGYLRSPRSSLIGRPCFGASRGKQGI